MNQHELLNQILDNSFHNKNDPNYLINTIKIAFNLGSSSPEYAYPAFLYFKNNLEPNITLDNTYYTDLAHLKKTLNNQAKNYFLSSHLDTSTILPTEFKELFTYFFNDLFYISSSHKYNYKDNEKKYYLGLTQYLTCAMYQNADVFSHMLDLLEKNNDKTVINDKTVFFNILEDYVNLYTLFNDSEKVKNIIENRLTYHNSDYEYFSLKPKLPNVVFNGVFSVQDDLSLTKLYRVLDILITPNEDYLKQQKLYIRNKTSNHDQINNIINKIEQIFGLETYLEALPFFKVNLTKVFINGNMPHSTGMRNNFNTFSAICANSDLKFNTNAIDYTGQYWGTQLLHHNRTAIFEKYDDININKKLLQQLYNDYIIFPHKEDLKIILFSHLDKDCITQAIEYYHSNANIIKDFFAHNPKIKNLDLQDSKFSFLQPLSHLLYSLNENPIVVYHALNFQIIHDILQVKTTKKYICTDEEKNKASQTAMSIVEQLKNIFNDIKFDIADCTIIPMLCNKYQSASFDKEEHIAIPSTTKQTQIDLSLTNVNMYVNNYTYFCLSNTINNTIHNTNVNVKKTLKI